ncbi:MAG: hypothetical protein K2X27_08715 [Candidatus Obscuribacterales bacterium]|nr:hypothetical protein [Candidatus Obscuribacterales bacterium]
MLEKELRGFLQSSVWVLALTFSLSGLKVQAQGTDFGNLPNSTGGQSSELAKYLSQMTAGNSGEVLPKIETVDVTHGGSNTGSPAGSFGGGGSDYGSGSGGNGPSSSQSPNQELKRYLKNNKFNNSTNPNKMVSKTYPTVGGSNDSATGSGGGGSDYEAKTRGVNTVHISQPRSQDLSNSASNGGGSSAGGSWGASSRGAGGGAGLGGSGIGYNGGRGTGSGNPYYKNNRRDDNNSNNVPSVYFNGGGRDRDDNNNNGNLPGFGLNFGGGNGGSNNNNNNNDNNGGGLGGFGFGGFGGANGGNGAGNNGGNGAGNHGGNHGYNGGTFGTPGNAFSNNPFDPNHNHHNNNNNNFPPNNPNGNNNGGQNQPPNQPPRGGSNGNQGSSSSGGQGNSAPPSSGPDQVSMPHSEPHPGPSTSASFPKTDGVSQFAKSIGVGAGSPSASLMVSSSVAAVSAAAGNILGQKLGNTPGQDAAQSKANQNAQKEQGADNLAAMERYHAAAAIDWVRSFLENFTTSGGNKWNTIRDRLFVPMAILLLLPGAVICQVKSIASQGFVVLGEIQPFEGIFRSIVSIFLIPATYLVVNYGIDIANSLTESVATTYRQCFGTDMYIDAFCGHIRAFPIREPEENPGMIEDKEAQMFNYFGTSPLARLEGKTLAIKYADPCVGLYIVPPDRNNDNVPYMVNEMRLAYNQANAAFTMAWVILCAVQQAYLYYLWFVGPVVAALWVYPSRQLREAFPSWIEGVVTLCCWSLFWSVAILLMACFHGVDDTGTIIFTALNFLTIGAAKFAFDFTGLVKDAGREAMSMAQKAAQAAAKADGKGGGGGGGGGGKEGNKGDKKDGNPAAPGGPGNGATPPQSASSSEEVVSPGVTPPPVAESPVSGNGPGHGNALPSAGGVSSVSPQGGPHSSSHAAAHRGLSTGPAAHSVQAGSLFAGALGAAFAAYASTNQNLNNLALTSIEDSAGGPDSSALDGADGADGTGAPTSTPSATPVSTAPVSSPSTVPASPPPGSQTGAVLGAALGAAILGPAGAQLGSQYGASAGSTIAGHLGSGGASGSSGSSGASGSSGSISVPAPDPAPVTPAPATPTPSIPRAGNADISTGVTPVSVTPPSVPTIPTPDLSTPSLPRLNVPDGPNLNMEMPRIELPNVGATPIPSIDTPSISTPSASYPVASVPDNVTPQSLSASTSAASYDDGDVLAASSQQTQNLVANQQAAAQEAYSRDYNEAYARQANQVSQTVEAEKVAQQQRMESEQRMQTEQRYNESREEFSRMAVDRQAQMQGQVQSAAQQQQEQRQIEAQQVAQRAAEQRQMEVKEQVVNAQQQHLAQQHHQARTSQNANAIIGVSAAARKGVLGPNGGVPTQRSLGKMSRNAGSAAPPQSRAPGQVGQAGSPPSSGAGGGKAHVVSDWTSQLSIQNLKRRARIIKKQSAEEQAQDLGSLKQIKSPEQ